MKNSLIQKNSKNKFSHEKLTH